MCDASCFNVLVACEESQAVANAFRERGFNAYSCDLKPCSGGHPEYHFQGDALDLCMWSFWDLIIAHPPCTYLSFAGNRWLKDNPDRLKSRDDALVFFDFFTRLSCNHICIENPVGWVNSLMFRPTQVIHPWQFGDEFSKRTCLWLKGLPKLRPTKIVSHGEFYIDHRGKRVNKWLTDAFRLPSELRQEVRSKTFPGIANAMAQQWGDFLLTGGTPSDTLYIQERLFHV